MRIVLSVLGFLGRSRVLVCTCVLELFLGVPALKVLTPNPLHNEEGSAKGCFVTPKYSIMAVILCQWFRQTIHKLLR